MSQLGLAATATIANGQTTSGTVDLGEDVIVGIQFPTMTGTSMTFLASVDGVTFVAVTDRVGTTYTLTIASSKYIVIPPADLAGIRYIQLVSGSSEGAARSIQIAVRQV